MLDLVLPLECGGCGAPSTKWCDTCAATLKVRTDEPHLVTPRTDPGVPVLPYLMPGGTDNKALSLIGIRGYGFAPLKLPPTLDFPAMFHGVDERVPLEALGFGRRVLADLLRAY